MMKVKELIKKLKTLDPELPVFIHENRGGYMDPVNPDDIRVSDTNFVWGRGGNGRGADVRGVRLR